MKSKTINSIFNSQYKIRFILLLLAIACFSFNGIGQSELYLANKTGCQLNVKIHLCGNSGYEVVVGPWAALAEITQVDIERYEVYFPGSGTPDYIIVCNTCEPLLEWGSNPCGTGNDQISTDYMNGVFKFSVY